jgi:hypothetical protein
MDFNNMIVLGIKPMKLSFKKQQQMVHLSNNNRDWTEKSETNHGHHVLYQS